MQTALLTDTPHPVCPPWSFALLRGYLCTYEVEATAPGPTQGLLATLTRVAGCWWLPLLPGIASMQEAPCMLQSPAVLQNVPTPELIALANDEADQR